MADRKLLEMALKVSGIYTRVPTDLSLYWIDRSDERDAEGHQVHPTCGFGRAFEPPWNPLEDDGDALRLAVKLNIQMTPGAYGDPYTVVQWWTGPSLIEQDFERVLIEGGNRAAGLRRAIVRAAAAIGKAMG